MEDAHLALRMASRQIRRSTSPYSIPESSSTSLHTSADLTLVIQVMASMGSALYVNSTTISCYHRLWITLHVGGRRVLNGHDCTDTIGVGGIFIWAMSHRFDIDWTTERETEKCERWLMFLLTYVFVTLLQVSSCCSVFGCNLNKSRYWLVVIQ